MEDAIPNGWVLVDRYGSYYGDAVYPRTPIRTEADLRRALATYAEQEPRKLWLECDGVPRIGLALGGPWGAVQALRRRSGERSYIAVSRAERPAAEVIFVGDWQPSYYPPAYLMPAAAAIERAVELFRGGGLSSGVEWEVSG